MICICLYNPAMYSDEFEALFEEDVYSGKRKRRPDGISDSDYYERRGWWRGCCCALVLMVMAGVSGAGVAVVFVRWFDDAVAETTTVIAVTQTLNTEALVPLDTEMPVTLTPFLTRTPTPTRESAFAEGAGEVVVMASPSATDEVAPTFTRDTDDTINRDSGERFEFFAQSSGFPRLVNVVDVTCSTERTDFTLLLDHSGTAAGDDVVYLEVTLQAEGSEASLASVEMDTPDVMFEEQMIITVGEESTISTEVLEAKTGDRIAAALDEAWTRERRRGAGVQEFTVTWYNTARQPDVGFVVEGLHPNRGGVLMSVRWSWDLTVPLTENPIRFQICSP